MAEQFKINENAKLPDRDIADYENIFLDIKDEYGPNTPPKFSLAILDYFKRQGIKGGTVESRILNTKLWSRFFKMYPEFADNIEDVKKQIGKEIVKERLDAAQSKPAPKQWKSGLEHRLQGEDDGDDNDKK